MARRDLEDREIELLGRMVRAGDNGLTLRTLAERVAGSELESRGYIDWVDNRLYLVTAAGRTYWEQIAPKVAKAILPNLAALAEREQDN